MLQIDDAGWGSLLGGVFISGYRVETGEYASYEIPVGLFQGENFGKQAYNKEVVDATIYLLGVLGMEDSESIEICRGDILKLAREYIKAQGYKMSEVKIEGELQNRIELELLKKVTGYGVSGINLKMLTEEQGLFFWQSLKWLKGGDINGKALPEREAFAKTGWPTYSFWADLPYELAKKEVKKYKGNINAKRYC